VAWLERGGGMLVGEAWGTLGRGEAGRLERGVAERSVRRRAAWRG
jgi:hypothetical protein